MFTVQYKARLLALYEGAERGQVLRRKGFDSAHLIEWRRARESGAGGGAPGPLMGQIGALTARAVTAEAQLARSRESLELIEAVSALLETFSESAEAPPAAEAVISPAVHDLAKQVGIARAKHVEIARAKQVGIARAKHVEIARAKQVGIARAKHVEIARAKQVGIARACAQLGRDPPQPVGTRLPKVGPPPACTPFWWRSGSVCASHRARR